MYSTYSRTTMLLRIARCASVSRMRFVASGLVLLFAGGCASIRVTDPLETATEQFLMSEAARQAIGQLATDSLRDRKVYVNTAFITSDREPAPQILFAIAELRAKLLTDGVRLVDHQSDAQIVLELRTGSIGIDRTEFLLGIPATAVPAGGTPGTGVSVVSISTPELALLKSTKQQGYASIAFVAYWADSGEIVAHSGPFIGRTLRTDYWIFGTGPHTIGNIPTVDK